MEPYCKALHSSLLKRSVIVMVGEFDKARGAYRRGSSITASDVYRAIVAHGGPK